MGSCRVDFKGLKLEKGVGRKIVSTDIVQTIMTNEANRIANVANNMAFAHNMTSKKTPAYSVKSGRNKKGIANATVYTSSWMGRLDNSKNNTLLKAGGS